MSEHFVEAPGLRPTRDAASPEGASLARFMADVGETNAERLRRTVIFTGLAAGFVAWLAWMLWPQVRHDFMPWLSEPVRVGVVAGWTGQLPDAPGLGVCDVAKAEPPGKLLLDGQIADARSPGRPSFHIATRGEVLIRCEHGSLALLAQPVARLSVAAPTTLTVGAPVRATLMAYDVAGGPLRVGERTAGIGWRTEGASSIRGTPTGPTVELEGLRAGDAKVVVTFDSLTARLDLKVVSP
jgi:hypothetical protein